MVAPPAASARMLITTDGFRYDPSSPVLLIRTPQSRLTFDLRLECAETGLRSALKKGVAQRLSSEPPERVHADFAAVRALVEASALLGGGESVSALSLGCFCYRWAALSGSTSAVNGLLYGLRRMEPFLGPAMESSLRRELATIRPVKHKRRPGNARSPDDKCRALSEAELAELAESLSRRLASGEVKPEDHTLAVLEATLVPRPAQIALLKVRDIVQIGWLDGHPLYALRVARIKQKGKARASSFRLRKLDYEMAVMLLAQGDRAKRMVISEGIDAENAPLFPRAVSISVLGTEFPELAGYLRHSTAADIQARIQNVLGVSSRSARRTIATMMRADNRSYRQIGLVLDNRPESARVYADDTPQMVARVEHKLGAALKPLADLFMGRPGGHVPPIGLRSSRP